MDAGGALLDTFATVAFGNALAPDTHAPSSRSSSSRNINVGSEPGSEPGGEPGSCAKLDDNASAASRQKSCNACVRGKRRCDKRTPQCSRCWAKSLDCVYQKLPPGAGAAASVSEPRSAVRGSSISMPSSAGPSSSVSAASARRMVSSLSGSFSLPPAASSLTSSAAASAANMATATIGGGGGGGGAHTATAACLSNTSTSPYVSDVPDVPDVPDVLDVPDFEMGFDLDSLGTGTDTSPESFQPDSGVPLASAHGSSGIDFSIADFISQAAAANDDDFWHLNSFGADTTDKSNIPPLPTSLAAAMAPPSMNPQSPPPPHQLQPIRDYSLVKDCANLCISVDPLTVHDPNTRIGYIVSFFKRVHDVFARTRALPFMHSRLWIGQLPKPILAAFSASAAYASCTSANKGWTVKLLVDAGREIHQEGERAVSNEDKLSRVQALLILNTMRIFDGDLILGAAADRELGLLLTWLKELRSMLDHLEAEDGCRGGDGLLIKGKPPRSWQDWVFLESTRRTLLTSYALVSMSLMLKSETPDAEMWSQENNFTASRHLWDATSSVEFYRSWREKPHFLITNMGFKEFWSNAGPEDCDDFTNLMLISQVGVDTVAHFMNGDTDIPVNAGRAP